MGGGGGFVVQRGRGGTAVVPRGAARRGTFGRTARVVGTRRAAQTLTRAARGVRPVRAGRRVGGRGRR